MRRLSRITGGRWLLRVRVATRLRRLRFGALPPKAKAPATALRFALHDAVRVLLWVVLETLLLFFGALVGSFELWKAAILKSLDEVVNQQLAGDQK